MHNSVGHLGDTYANYTQHNTYANTTNKQHHNKAN